MSKAGKLASPSLIDQADVGDPIHLNPDTENAWIEVIQKMDSAYADLVRYQVELEQKNSELEEAQQFIRSVMAAMTDVLIVCDFKGNIQEVNQALENLTGRKQSELAQQPIGMLFSPESQPMVDQFPEKLGSDAIVDCEVNMLGRDGALAPLAMNCSSRYDHEGRLVGMVLIGRPVGELRRAYEDLNQAHRDLKQTQQQLVHSEKMASLGRLVAGVAHELNNPISFVFGNMHALQSYGDRINGYLKEVAGEIDEVTNRSLRDKYRIDRIENDMGSLIEGSVEGAERISEIVQDLRRYSGGQREELERFDLVQQVETAVHWVVKACREKPKVDFQLDEALEINSRQGQVHQILVNLIQNAVDVTEGQSAAKLWIRCCLNSDLALVSVRDSGPGIAAEELPKLFDPFYTTKAVGKGTGLGLYISYGLAQDLGGNLTAENHLAGGAIFTLTLPVDGAEHE